MSYPGSGVNWQTFVTMTVLKKAMITWFRNCTIYDYYRQGRKSCVSHKALILLTSGITEHVNTATVCIVMSNYPLSSSYRSQLTLAHRPATPWPGCLPLAGFPSCDSKMNSCGRERFPLVVFGKHYRHTTTWSEGTNSLCRCHYISSNTDLLNRPY